MPDVEPPVPRPRGNGPTHFWGFVGVVMTIAVGAIAGLIYAGVTNIQNDNRTFTTIFERLETRADETQSLLTTTTVLPVSTTTLPRQESVTGIAATNDPLRLNEESGFINYDTEGAMFEQHYDVLIQLIRDLDTGLCLWVDDESAPSQLVGRDCAEIAAAFALDPADGPGVRIGWRFDHKGSTTWDNESVHRYWLCFSTETHPPDWDTFSDHSFCIDSGGLVEGGAIVFVRETEGSDWASTVLVPQNVPGVAMLALWGTDGIGYCPQVSVDSTVVLTDCSTASQVTLELTQYVLRARSR